LFHSLKGKTQKQKKCSTSFYYYTNIKQHEPLSSRTNSGQFVEEMSNLLRSKSRSESEGERGSSETPPHWKEEMQRTKAYQPPSVERWSKGERYIM